MRYQQYLRGGTPLWTPLAEPCLWAWWDPMNTATVTTVDASITNPNNVSVSPWGSINLSSRTSDTITDDTSYNYHMVIQDMSSFVSNKQATVSAEFKANSLNYACIFNYNTSAWGALINLTTGSYSQTGCTATPLYIGDGWWRLTCEISSTDSDFRLGIATAVSTTISSFTGAHYTGDGTGSIQVRNINVIQRNVSAFGDRSGNGHNLSQATAANQPILSASAEYNGKNVLNYVNANVSALASGDTTWPQPFTMYVVGAPSATPTARNMFRGSDSVPWAGLDAGHHLKMGAVDNNLTSSTDDHAAGVFTIIFNGSGSAGYKGTTLKMSGNPGSIGSSNKSMILGASHALSTPWAGNMAAVIIYSAAHGAAQQARVARNLARMYGVSL